ncbi:MAG: hypothetical protein AAGB01_01490 [Cyanobacteria bacterium P01_F01_bin.42]
MINTAQSMPQEALRESVNRNAGSINTDKSQQLPLIEDWAVQTKKGKLYVIGKAKGHPRHSDGSQIKTTAIVSQSKLQDRTLVMTRNSTYELGRPSQAQAKKEKAGQASFKPKYYAMLPDPWGADSGPPSCFTELQ